MVLLALAVVTAGQTGLPLFRLSDENVWEPWRDLQIARSMLPLHGSQRDYVGPGYGRDRDYAVFLWNARHHHPEIRRILLLTPDMADWYRYRAAYRMAPAPVEQFETGAAQDGILMTWRAPVPTGWTEFFQWEHGALARRDGDAP
jgi:hypothetical protein